MKCLITDRQAFISNLVRDKDVLDIGCVEHSLESCQGTRAKYWLHESIRQSAKSALGMDCEKDAVSKLCAMGYDIITADATNFTPEPDLRRNRSR